MKIKMRLSELISWTSRVVDHLYKKHIPIICLKHALIGPKKYVENIPVCLMFLCLNFQ